MVHCIYLFFFIMGFSISFHIQSSTPILKKNIYMTNSNHKYYFLQFLNEQINLSEKLEWVPKYMEDKFIIGKTLNNDGMIYNYCFQDKNFRKARFTYFNGKSKFQYFGLVLHPNYHYDIPIFNFELLLRNNESLVYTLNMIKIDNHKIYDEKYEKPFMKIKQKYPDLQENMAVKLSGYNVLGNQISKAILLGKFNVKNKDEPNIAKIYNDIVFSSYKEYLTSYLGFFDRPIKITSTNKEMLENIREKHQLFDMKKAFVESKYDIRKCFDDEWYRSMLYDFFYDLEQE